MAPPLPARCLPWRRMPRGLGSSLPCALLERPPLPPRTQGRMRGSYRASRLWQAAEKPPFARARSWCPSEPHPRLWRAAKRRPLCSGAPPPSHMERTCEKKELKDACCARGKGGNALTHPWRPTSSSSAPWVARRYCSPTEPSSQGRAPGDHHHEILHATRRVRGGGTAPGWGDTTSVC